MLVRVLSRHNHLLRPTNHMPKADLAFIVQRTLYNLKEGIDETRSAKAESPIQARPHETFLAR